MHRNEAQQSGFVAERTSDETDELSSRLTEAKDVQSARTQSLLLRHRK